MILGYHAVSPSWRTTLAVSEEQLHAQISYLAQRGYVGLTLSESERLRRKGTLPHRSLVLTFDDGYASTLRALPILDDFQFPGTVFVVTDFVDSGEPLSWYGITEWLQPETIEELRPLRWDDAAMLIERGWEVGSHTMSHPLLTRLDDQELSEELVQSRRTIEARLGSCTSLAYPYGVADERVASAAAEAGYEVACTLTFAHVADEPLRRARVGMNPRDRGLRLKIQVSRLGQSMRRSGAARLARALHRRRSWLPDG